MVARRQIVLGLGGIMTIFECELHDKVMSENNFLNSSCIDCIDIIEYQNKKEINKVKGYF
jgi:hypothetical protein